MRFDLKEPGEQRRILCQQIQNALSPEDLENRLRLQRVTGKITITKRNGDVAVVVADRNGIIRATEANHAKAWQG